MKLVEAGEGLFDFSKFENRSKTQGQMRSLNVRAVDAADDKLDKEWRWALVEKTIHSNFNHKAENHTIIAPVCARKREKNEEKNDDHQSANHSQK